MNYRMTIAAACLVLAGTAAAQHSGTGNALPSAPERELAPAEEAAEPTSHAGTGADASDIDLFKSAEPAPPPSHGSKPPSIELLSPNTAVAAPPATVTPLQPAPAPDAIPTTATPAPAVAPPPVTPPAAMPQTNTAAPAPTESASPAATAAPPAPPAPAAPEDRDIAPYGPAAKGWQVWSRVLDGRAGCWAVKGADGQSAPVPASGRLFDGPKPYVIVTMTAPGAQPTWRIIHDGLPTQDDRIFVVGGTGWVEPSSFASVLELDSQVIDVYGKGFALKDGQRVPFETTGKIEMSGLGTAVGSLTRCVSGQPAPAPTLETGDMEEGGGASDDDAAAADEPAVTEADTEGR